MLPWLRAGRRVLEVWGTTPLLFKTWTSSVQTGAAGSCQVLLARAWQHSALALGNSLLPHCRSFRSCTPVAMPIVGVNRDKLFERMGRTYSELLLRMAGPAQGWNLL